MSDNQFRLSIQLVLVLGLLALGTAIALGKVEEKTSFGLATVLVILNNVATNLDKDKKEPNP